MHLRGGGCVSAKPSQPESDAEPVKTDTPEPVKTEAVKTEADVPKKKNARIFASRKGNTGKRGGLDEKWVKVVHPKSKEAEKRIGEATLKTPLLMGLADDQRRDLVDVRRVGLEPTRPQPCTLEPPPTVHAQCALVYNSSSYGLG